jgi:hypothetical protein
MPSIYVPKHFLSRSTKIVGIIPYGIYECKVKEIVAQGDHHVVIAEVIEAHLTTPPAGRADAAILEMKDLGENVFYGG